MSVQGLNIVYIHVKPKLPQNSNIKVVPLLLLHGWPGSIREFYEIIPLLTQPQKGNKNQINYSTSTGAAQNYISGILILRKESRFRGYYS